MRKNGLWLLVDLAFQLGFYIAVPLLGGVLIGVAIDRHLNTKPLFIIIGLIIAFLVSSVWIFRFVRRIMEEDNA